MRLLAWLLGRWLVRRYRHDGTRWRSSLAHRYEAQWERGRRP